MQSRVTVWLSVAGTVLFCLNAAFSVFLALWIAADGQAINRMESEAGFDSAYLIPNANLMWIAAYVSLVLLLIIDALFAALLISRKKWKPIDSQ